MRKIIFIVCIILVVAAAAIGGILWWNQKQSSQSNADAAATFNNTNAQNSSDALPAELIIPEGSIGYQNAQYHFALAYPKELSVKEYTEAAGGHTTSFEDVAGDKGFQIFVLPYGDSQIASSRIKEDTHSTAGTPQEVVLLGGVHALLFESRDPVLGQMREVWFLHNGYLYEVTGYIGLDDWLASIMSTWQFLE